MNHMISRKPRSLKHFPSTNRPLRMLGAAATLFACAGVCAQAIVTPYPTPTGDDTTSVAAGAFGGVYATASTATDSVDIRDIRGNVIASIPQARIAALCPWMALDSGPDGPAALAVSDSGRLVFIAVHDTTALPSQPGGAILRYDITTDTLSVYNRLDFASGESQRPLLGMVHFKGRLYLGVTDGTSAKVYTFAATANQTSGTLSSATTLPSGVATHGLAIDRLNSTLYAASEGAIYRAAITTSTSLPFTLVGNISNIRGIAWSDHYGISGAGLYVLSSNGPGASTQFVRAAQAQGTQTFAPTTYSTSASEQFAIASTADGRLIEGQAGGAVALKDSSDTRLSFDGWAQDEFNQHIKFARGLISPDGQRDGWVIDADVAVGGTHFHPATPDAAGFTLMLLVAADRINHDPQALADAQRILVRYAGLNADGVGPSITADGIMRHWIDFNTGQGASGWDPEFATFSTMLILEGAMAAKNYWAADFTVQQAASKIICQVKNWDSYVNNVNKGLYFKGLVGGGPDTGGGTTFTFNEGILFTTQAAFYGGAISQSVGAYWLDRSKAPTYTYLTGRSLAGDLPAFVTHYPTLLLPAFRNDPAWQAQFNNERDSNAAWTDDNGPQYDTVFSAGTTKGAWYSGGYHADSLGAHTGDVATFTSLEAFASRGRTIDAVGAYQAYRTGGRQAWKSGASLLYRKSNVDRTYLPDSAGMPDVGLGGLGLAELLAPGFVDTFLARPFPACGTLCYANCDGSTDTPLLSAQDFTCFLTKFRAGDIYANCDLSVTPPVLSAQDFTCFLTRFRGGCP
jgi:hypothetical protein